MRKTKTNSDLGAGLQAKIKEQQEVISSQKREIAELRVNETTFEGKLKTVNEVHSQKTKALLKSINNLKKEIQKTKFEQKDNVRHLRNERLMEDIKLQEVAINALRKLVNDEDRCNLAIKRELEKGPARIRVLSREELKIEVKKYKNISLRIVKEFKKVGAAVPGVAKNLEKEQRESLGEGLQRENSNLDLEELEDSQFEVNSNFMESDDKLPPRTQRKIEKLEETIVNLKMDAKNKNDRIVELMNDLEEMKIQVLVRDKTISMQQRQLEDLLEEMRESKSKEVEIQMLRQENDTLSGQVDRFQEEVNSTHKFKAS